MHHIVPCAVCDVSTCSIVQWEAFNESDMVSFFDPAEAIAYIAQLDPTRLIDTDSGWGCCHITYTLVDVSQVARPTTCTLPTSTTCTHICLDALLLTLYSCSHTYPYPGVCNHNTHGSRC